MRFPDKGYFITEREHWPGLVVVLKGPWKPQFANVIISQRIPGLRLSRGSWPDDDISFVSELTKLSCLEVYSWKVKDITPMQSLKHLEEIGLACEFRKPIDFTVFTKLVDCYLEWRPKCDSLFECKTLKKLHLVRYPYPDLTPLTKLTNLEILKITSRKLESLKGIERFKKLEFLDLFECTQLSSLSGIESLQKIATLNIRVCNKVTEITPVGKMKKLRKLMLNNCGDIESLHPIRGCKELRVLIFSESTKIIDGDMTVFQYLPNLEMMRFDGRRHYTHKWQEAEAILEERSK